MIKISKKKIKLHLKKKYTNKDYTLRYIFYKKRLMFECSIIISIGLSDYFLIVKDFIKWSIKNKIPVRPGRGSGSGSLISYSLGLTILDPLKHDLLFERFLNTKRASMPDLDIDFCQKGRELVLDYVKKKYGLSFVCQIITFGTMGIKAAIRDVGRVMNLNYNFINKISKLIPYKCETNIDEFFKNNLILYKECKKERKVKKLIKLAFKAEGLIKSLGIHSGGLVISSNKIYNFFPLWTQNNIIASQFCKDDIEYMGLTKFDFLGLITLTVLDDCLKNIKKNHKINNISLFDNFCYINLKKSNTVGVFQLESPGMRKMLKKAKPEYFQHIIALISLYRPGPMHLLNSFCLRKSGKEKIIYPDSKLKNILKETYGIIIYQE